MNTYAWTRQRLGEYALALTLVANVAGLGAAGLVYGWIGLAAAMAASLCLWLVPWPRLARACGHKLDAWLVAPGPARAAPPAHAHPPRRARRVVDPSLPLYYRVKLRWGARVAALAVSASALGLFVVAAAFWIDEGATAAIATLIIGAPLLVGVWRPDVEWVGDTSTSDSPGEEDTMNDLYYNIAYRDFPMNIYYVDDDWDNW